MAQPPRKNTNRSLNRHRKAARPKHPQTMRRDRVDEAQDATLILLNKPFGYVSQFSGDDKTLADLIADKDVYPAGRLDKDSEGLLLLTNHGSLQHRISHPKMKLLKHYWVQVEGDITDHAIKQLIDGVRLKDGPAKAVFAERISPPEVWSRNPPVRYRASIPDSWIDITLNEGRNRQVRRMTAAAGFPTLRLIRHRIGDWDIANLESGKYHTISLSARALEQIRG